MSRKVALVGAFVCAAACTGGKSGGIGGPWDDDVGWTWEEPELADATAAWEGYDETNDSDAPASRCARCLRKEIEAWTIRRPGDRAIVVVFALTPP